MNKIFGESWRTTISGYILAGLIVAQDMTSNGEADLWKISIAVLIAILGRVAGDSKQVKENI